MIANSPPQSTLICQRLFAGYQFSPSDIDDRFHDLYQILLDNRDWFQQMMTTIGFTLIDEYGVIFLRNEEKELSKEDKQTIVILFLLADLWLEKGESFADLFVMRINWHELDWFREGYGRAYLSQVKIDDGDLQAIRELFYKMGRRGLLVYHKETDQLTLRRPAQRIIDKARFVYQQLGEKAEASDAV